VFQIPSLSRLGLYHINCFRVCVRVPRCISETTHRIIFIFGVMDYGYCPMMPIILDFWNFQNGRPQGPKIADFQHFGLYLLYKSWDHPNFLHGAKKSQKNNFMSIWPLTKFKMATVRAPKLTIFNILVNIFFINHGIILIVCMVLKSHKRIILGLFDL